MSRGEIGVTRSQIAMTITSVPTGIIEARELPYLSHVPTDDRSIVAMPFYDTDTGQFYGCVPQASRKILLLPLIDLVLEFCDDLT